LRTAEIMASLREKPPAVYTLCVGLGLEPKNRFFLERMPPVLTPSRDRLILMVDMPLGPNNAVPDYLARKIEDDVAHGARLVILGGPFTLGNGCFKGSCLEQVLPVELRGPWETAKAQEPLPLHSTDPGVAELLDDEERPAILHYHDVTTRSGARVLAHAGEIPILFFGRYKQGTVTVFTAAPLGKFGNGYKPYWEWSRWPEFVARIAGVR